MKRQKASGTPGVSGPDNPGVCFPNLPGYSNPTGNEYPIIAYNNYMFPKMSLTTDAEIQKVLQSIKSCGFNATIWNCGGYASRWWKLYDQYYQVAQSLGLPTVLNISGMMPVKQSPSSEKDEYSPTLNELSEILNLNIDNPNLWGFLMVENPKYINWAYSTSAPPSGDVDLWKAYLAYVRDSNGHIAVIDLSVSNNTDIIGESSSTVHVTEKNKYLRYLKAIKDKFCSNMLAVNISPVVVNSPSIENGTEYSIKKDYYYSIEAIGQFSKLYSLPFWMFMLSNQHTRYEYNADGSFARKVEYPFPSVGILRFQAMTALAFGIKGLVFQSYCMCPDEYVEKNTDLTESEFKCGDESSCLFMFEGKSSYESNRTPLLYYQYASYVDDMPTEIWNNCQIVIPEIKQIGNLLLGSTFQEAQHVYGPLLTSKFDETTEFSSGIGCISDARASGMGFVITRLKKGGDTYMAIVSHDPVNEQDITLAISTDFQEVVADTQADATVKFSSINKASAAQTITRKLKPGGMILLRY